MAKSSTPIKLAATSVDAEVLHLARFKTTNDGQLSARGRFGSLQYQQALRSVKDSQYEESGLSWTLVVVETPRAKNDCPKTSIAARLVTEAIASLLNLPKPSTPKPLNPKP